MDELDYETHLRTQKTLWGIDPDLPHEQIVPQHRELMEEQAQGIHALTVFNPLRDWIMNANTIAEQLSNDNAQYYMRYGVGRRFSMVWHAYRKVIFRASPNRKEPLNHDDQQDFNQSLNVIYMNLRGILDNFAWCFLWEKENSEADRIGNLNVDLFKPQFRRMTSFSEISEDINSHKDWNMQVKKRRDPVAHRVPLYIPSIFTNDDAQRYRELFDQYLQKAAENDFESSDALFAQIDQIGTFLPAFMHHPGDGLVPIYPTLPTDMAHLIRIGATIERSLLAQ